MSFLTTSRKGAPILTNYSVGATAVQIANLNKNRKSLLIQNQGSVTVFLGTSGLVSNSGPAIGYALFAGTTFTDNATDQPWWCVGASGTSNVCVVEVT